MAPRRPTYGEARFVLKRRAAGQVYETLTGRTKAAAVGFRSLSIGDRVRRLKHLVGRK